MKERPIPFSAPMVRALLAGTKTQTRRVIARPLQNPGWTTYRYFGPSVNNPTCTSKAIECGPDYPDGKEDQVLCPYGAAGDRLWVREAWRSERGLDHLSGAEIADACINAGYSKPWAPLQYEADGERRDWMTVGTPIYPPSLSLIHI